MNNLYRYRPMNKLVTLSLLVSINCAMSQSNDAPGISPESIGDLPLQRGGVRVENQRSPYGLPEQTKKKVSSNKQQYSQEAQIREILGRLHVTGVIGGGKKVLLHDITLEEGELVPNVLPGQTEVLLVKQITPEKVYIEWIEKIKRKATRTMEISIDMSSRVEAIIPGQPKGGAKTMGIVRMPDEEEDQ